MNNPLFSKTIPLKYAHYSLLAYSIVEYPPMYTDRFFELKLFSTSLSELEGSPSGILGCFTYLDRAHAIQDIEDAVRIYNIIFDAL